MNNQESQSQQSPPTDNNVNVQINSQQQSTQTPSTTATTATPTFELIEARNTYSRLYKSSELDLLCNIIIDLPGLDNIQKNILRCRYVLVIYDFNRRTKIYSFIFHLGRFLITVGSLIVPALLSIQYTDAATGFFEPYKFQAIIFWSTWILSLLVTTSNGVLTLFKIDKKYYFLHTTLERLRSEGWQYLELSGKYATITSEQARHNPPQQTSHKIQFMQFTYEIERIKMRQVEEEYYKQTDSAQNVSHIGAKSEIVPKTITKAINDLNGLEQRPPTLQHTLNKMIPRSSSDTNLQQMSLRQNKNSSSN
jgi:hypothetical protein